MFTLNQITLIGFTGSEAEVHYTQNGTVVAVVSVATKDSWKDADGDWQSRTDWHRIVTFGKLADYPHAGKGLVRHGAGYSSPSRVRTRRDPSADHGSARRISRQAGPRPSARWIGITIWKQQER